MPMTKPVRIETGIVGYLSRRPYVDRKNSHSSPLRGVSGLALLAERTALSSVRLGAAARTQVLEIAMIASAAAGVEPETDERAAAARYKLAGPISAACEGRTIRVILEVGGIAELRRMSVPTEACGAGGGRLCRCASGKRRAVVAAVAGGSVIITLAGRPVVVPVPGRPVVVTAR